MLILIVIIWIVAIIYSPFDLISTIYGLTNLTALLFFIKLVGILCGYVNMALSNIDYQSSDDLKIYDRLEKPNSIIRFLIVAGISLYFYYFAPYDLLFNIIGATKMITIYYIFLCVKYLVNIVFTIIFIDKNDTDASDD